VFSVTEDHDICDCRLGDFAAAIPEYDVVTRLASHQLSIVPRARRSLVKYQRIAVIDRLGCELYRKSLLLPAVKRTPLDLGISASLDD
jgi:hypothetical protein